ncbi:MAG: VWA domain-containing protein [Flavobacteriales bacterium]|nr:VWA domain-containing protein [Flavobacteriales bacterium]
MKDVEFAHIELLYGLLIIPIMALWYWRMSNQARADIQVSSFLPLQDMQQGFKVYLRHGLFALRILALAALILGLARPQTSTSWENRTMEGIDIVVVLDISSSMLSRDLKPNRLEASKQVALDFIENRPVDRVGLVVFSGESFTQCPLTTDHSVLKSLFGDIKVGMVTDGTAIGMGLATGVNRLIDSKAISKVIILLTDGENNSGSVAPVTASEIASSFGVRVYTIGIGTKGMAMTPVRKTERGFHYEQRKVSIDEELLKEIASNTGGRYFRATDNRTLEEIYTEIDKLEKSKIEVTEYRKKTEQFLPLALLAGILLVLELLLRNTFFRSIP